MDRARPRLVIAGAAGRLGRSVLAEALRQGFPIAGAVDRVRSTPSTGSREIEIAPVSELASLLDEADVYLSATNPAAERRNLPIVARAGRPAVVATTGLGPPNPRWLEACARRIPIVLEPNFSLGVAILREALRSIGPLPADFDVSIVETHRREKADHPSGTARSIAYDLARAGVRGWHPAAGRWTAGEAEIASLRAGETPGIHVVQISGPGEMLRFEHVAYGRHAFATGMLLAARGLFRRGPELPPGFYSLPEIWGGAQP